jgi:hypothetical protein
MVAIHRSQLELTEYACSRTTTMLRVIALVVVATLAVAFVAAGAVLLMAHELAPAG